MEEQQNELKIKRQMEPLPKDGRLLRYLYHTRSGRVICRAMAARPVSKVCGRFLDSRMSKFLIHGFVHLNGIDLDEYVPVKYRCFNDCFTREIRPENRPVDQTPEHLVSPCDGLLSVWHIRDDLIMPIKQSRYTLTDLLQNKELAERYRDGICMVFRLCVNHYHRYCYPDSGMKGESRVIPGKLHTVRPIATRGVPVYTENCREYTVLRSRHFGDIVQMEVGAMLVGKICNREETGYVCRGEEKGYFAYGGSTIVLLFQKDRVRLDDWIFEAAEAQKEIPVKMGQWIGTKLG